MFNSIEYTMSSFNLDNYSDFGAQINIITISQCSKYTQFRYLQKVLNRTTSAKKVHINFSTIENYSNRGRTKSKLIFFFKPLICDFKINGTTNVEVYKFIIFKYCEHIWIFAKKIYPGIRTNAVKSS